jgi:hypothetical protein
VALTVASAGRTRHHLDFSVQRRRYRGRQAEAAARRWKDTERPTITVEV